MNQQSLPLISVVVPFVNHQTYVQKCWENLQQQTYKNIELIFINNGSNDGSDLIAQKLANVHPEKIKLYHEYKKGIPYARNRGLVEANGEFISFLDIDDKFTSDKLTKLYQLLLEFPEAKMAYGQTLRIYSNTGRQIIQDTGVAKKGINYPPDLPIDWTKSFYRLPQTGATLTRTTAAKEIGGFPENLLLGNDDVGYHIHLALKYPIIFEPFVAVEYYRHEKSEGARLNENTSVHNRYFDAHLKVTEPAGRVYFWSTSDITLWGHAQKGLFLNYIDAFIKNKNGNSNTEVNSRFFFFYKIMILLFRALPFTFAQLIYKIVRRFVNAFSPIKYPLK